MGVTTRVLGKRSYLKYSTDYLLSRNELALCSSVLLKMDSSSHNGKIEVMGVDAGIVNSNK